MSAPAGPTRDIITDEIKFCTNNLGRLLHICDPTIFLPTHELYLYTVYTPMGGGAMVSGENLPTASASSYH
jgi:hypothetical protein